MKQLGRQILLLVIATIGLASCNPSFWVGIETQHPAKITLPPSATKVLVVNNAIPQSPEYGIELSFNQKKLKYPFPLRLDSALWTSVISLHENISDAHFFQELTLYEKTLRNDDQWLKSEIISNEKCQSLLNETGSDVMISVDRLLLKMNQNITPVLSYYFLEPTYIFLNISLELKLQCSVYLQGRENPLTSFSVLDSLSYIFSISCDSATLYNVLPNSILRAGAHSVAQKMSEYFVPGWQVADRFIYSSQNARMREAGGYFKRDKWDQAKSIWLSLYEETSKPKTKARLAMNLAVTWEIQDRRETALEWAEKSKSHYGQLKQGECDEEVERIAQYCLVLQKRITDSRLLDYQMGIE